MRRRRSGLTLKPCGQAMSGECAQPTGNDSPHTAHCGSVPHAGCASSLPSPCSRPTCEAAQRWGQRLALQKLAVRSTDCTASAVLPANVDWPVAAACHRHMSSTFWCDGTNWLLVEWPVAAACHRHMRSTFWCDGTYWLLVEQYKQRNMLLAGSRIGQISHAPGGASPGPGRQGGRPRRSGTPALAAACRCPAPRPAPESLQRHRHVGQLTGRRDKAPLVALQTMAGVCEQMLLNPSSSLLAKLSGWQQKWQLCTPANNT